MTEIAAAGQYRLGDRMVRRIGYGAMRLTGPGIFGPPRDHDAALAILRAAVAAGVNHIDTSDYYGPYVTNRLIREALAPYPDELVIVTKLGGRRGENAEWLPANSPDDLRWGIEGNLENLGVDRIDVVNMRYWGDGHAPAEGPVEPQLRVLADYQRQGVIGHIGVSHVTATQIKQAQEICTIACVQNHYNLAHRGDDAVIDNLAVQGIPFVPYFPLGGFSPLQSSTLNNAAADLRVTPMQLALAWLLRRSENILLIPGTSSLTHLEENLAVAEINIPDATMAVLDAIGADGASH